MPVNMYNGKPSTPQAMNLSTLNGVAFYKCNEFHCNKTGSYNVYVTGTSNVLLKLTEGVTYKIPCVNIKSSTDGVVPENDIVLFWFK